MPCPSPGFGSVVVILVPGLDRGEEEKLLPPRAGGSGCPPALVTTPELLGAAICRLTGRRLSCWRGRAVLLAGRVIFPAGFCSCPWVFPWLCAGGAWQVYRCKREPRSSMRQLWRGIWGCQPRRAWLARFPISWCWDGGLAAVTDHGDAIEVRDRAPHGCF